MIETNGIRPPRIVKSFSASIRILVYFFERFQRQNQIRFIKSNLRRITKYGLDTRKDSVM